MSIPIYFNIRYNGQRFLVKGYHKCPKNGPELWHSDDGWFHRDEPNKFLTECPVCNNTLTVDKQ